MRSKSLLIVFLGVAFAANPLYSSAKKSFRHGARHAFAECVLELGRLGWVDVKKAGEWSNIVFRWSREAEHE